MVSDLNFRSVSADPPNSARHQLKENDFAREAGREVAGEAELRIREAPERVHARVSVPSDSGA